LMTGTIRRLNKTANKKTHTLRFMRIAIKN